MDYQDKFYPTFKTEALEFEDDLVAEGIVMELANLIVENTPQGNQKIKEIAEKYDVSKLCICGNPALIYSLEHHNFEAFKIFIQSGALIDELGRNGIAEDGTALHLAAITPDPCYLDFLVAQGANINARGYGSQKTPVAQAIQNCFFQNANQLIEYGADVNVPDAAGQTPLYEAIGVGSPAMVCDLFCAGAKADITDNKGLNPLHYNLIVGDFLPHEHEGNIIIPGDYITKVLVHYGCYTDVPDDEGNRPLHYACAEKRCNAAEFLVVQNGVDVNAQNNKELTCLHLAVALKSLFLMHLLLSNKANPNLPDENGNLPLHVAAQLNFVPGIRMLLKHGAIKTLTNSIGLQPVDLTSNMMAANLLSVPKYGQDLDSMYNNAPEHVKRAAFRHYMIAKQCSSKKNRTK